MCWKIISNPFEKFSEKNLLFIGILSILVGSLCGHYFSVTFDGILDAHSSEVTFVDSLKENLINIFVLFTLLFIIGKIIYKKRELWIF
ncbi:hypothetical protein [Frigoriflavimonas asaccharolytica]|uniref:Uncharacterized protein n=1 Tax=Frigoriflavimonas asaccharolytica TaxID=2735899 RepID=A0A8J8K8J1_9FLAO|nr:hypothetical protein [Frigoriflavimonas asaccharolytica]NRS92012.1 hypothetical protein [Frigoriflavimonas asaccharolytica]